MVLGDLKESVRGFPVQGVVGVWGSPGAKDEAEEWSERNHVMGIIHFREREFISIHGLMK